MALTLPPPIITSPSELLSVLHHPNALLSRSYRTVMAPVIVGWIEQKHG
jgi:hypothetical protein